jgi:molybdopterin molybdotransferase
MSRLPSPDEALARMLAQVRSLETETVALDEALGRALAQDVDARRDQPPFRASAMDGWAVRRGDALSAEARLRVIGESAAGRGFDRAVGPGEAVRIFTGAPVPEGADCVVIQENASRAGEAVRLGPLEGASGHIRPRGGDFQAGQRLLAKGVRLDPWRISLAAAAGYARVEVVRRPRVAILSTGDEIVPAGGPVGPWAIWNSGGPALQGLCRTWGAAAVQLAPAGDSEDDIAAAAAGAEADLLVLVGGASVGEHDLVKPALKRLGLELFVEGVAMRPGKPSWFGRLSDGRLVLGCPGNPASALVCAELFLRAVLFALQGLGPARTPLFARLAEAMPSNGPRAHYLRAELRSEADGTLVVRPFLDQDSSLVSVFAHADALLHRPAGAPAVEEGTVVEVLPLDRL